MHDSKYDYVFELTTDEQFWVDNQPFLLSRGYRLRPRYEPGWIGSWKTTGVNPLLCEDSLASYPWNVIDAVRVADNVKVSLKLVPTFTEQIPIALYLSSVELLSDPRNRTVRILDFIPVPAADQWGLLVMPFLRDFDDPPFEFRSETIEAARQILNGLEFMHEHNVAHRDACRGNIMMDATRVIPGGFHHAARETHNGITWKGRNIKWTSRLSVAPVDYFFIDFGLSNRYPSVEERGLVFGIVGQDDTVPELIAGLPCDPFKVDIYQIGGVLQKLVDIYRGLGFFCPLAAAMMRTDPLQRPSASEALRQFEGIVSKLGPRAMKARIVLRKNWLPVKVWRSVRGGF